MLAAETKVIDTNEASRVLTFVNELIADSDAKKTTKLILKAFLDKITFNKNTKQDITMHLCFDQPTVNKLNSITKSDSTANSKAVGSFTLSKNICLKN